MKRLLSALLVAVLLLAAFPVTIISAEETAPVTAAAKAVVYGDVNDDGNVNNRDLGLLQQYLNDWNVDVNVDAADVNYDGKVNNRDLGLLQQYLNDWDVTITVAAADLNGDGKVNNRDLGLLQQLLNA